MVLSHRAFHKTHTNLVADFGVIINFLWLVVPCLMLVEVVRSDVREKEALEGGKAKGD